MLEHLKKRGVDEETISSLRGEPENTHQFRYRLGLKLHCLSVLDSAASLFLSSNWERQHLGCVSAFSREMCVGCEVMVTRNFTYTEALVWICFSSSMPSVVIT